MSPQINVFFYKLSWPWCLITAIEQYIVNFDGLKNVFYGSQYVTKILLPGMVSCLESDDFFFESGFICVALAVTL